MKLTRMESHDLEVLISYDELLIVYNALNELCNGIEVYEFHTRIGASIDEFQRIVKTIGNMIETAERAKVENMK